MSTKKKRKRPDDIGGLINVDPKTIQEPKDNPLDFPLILTCGDDIWHRVAVSEGTEAIYVWKGEWIIKVRLKEKS